VSCTTIEIFTDLMPKRVKKVQEPTKPRENAVTN
jgi:hypothetical protein